MFKDQMKILSIFKKHGRDRDKWRELKLMQIILTISNLKTVSDKKSERK